MIELICFKVNSVFVCCVFEVKGIKTKVYI